MTDEIEGCPLSYVCDMKWEGLIETPNPNIRHCSTCATNVHWVKGKSEMNKARSLGRCIAFTLDKVVAPPEDDGYSKVTLMGRF